MNNTLRNTLALLAVGILTAGALSPPAHSANAAPVVHTAEGLLRGLPPAPTGVVAFEGIPFGAPPVGNLRWRPPQPVRPWKGVRSAEHFGNACIQPHQMQRSPNNRAVDLPDSPAMSEDCLYLNVWTPSLNTHAALPVMVWIYGGAYTEGAGSTPYNQGDTLAAKGVVIVTFNYRLGAFGFLAHPELTAESPHHASGNYALADTLATLQWVKRNIAHFGGDPGNVTLFGESAGAAMSSALVGSPLAAGLFKRSISESGTWMGLNLAPMRTRESAEQQTVNAAAAIGKTSLAALRALPAAEAAKLPKQGMIVDGWIIPEDLSKTFAAHRQNRADVLVGSNRDEGSFAAGFGPPMTAARWKAGAAQRWGTLAELGLKAYPGSTNAEAAFDNTRMFADNLEWISRLYAVSQRQIGNHAYVYHFMHVPPRAAGATDLGVCHTCELPYVFDHLGALRLYPDSSSPQLALASAADHELARLMSSYWINFARTGNPNAAGLPNWPMIETVTEGPALQLGESAEPGATLGPIKAALYQGLYERQMAQH